MDYLESVSDDLSKMASWAEAEFSEPISGELADISGQTKNCVDGLNQGIEDARGLMEQLEVFREQFEELLSMDLNSVAEGALNGGSAGMPASADSAKVLTPYKHIPGDNRGRH